jgi:O-succinylbenzoic acid--CoA ligase
MIFNFLNRDIEVEGDRIALISHGKSYTYKDLNYHIENTTAILSEKYNISGGAHTALLCDNNFDFVIMVLSLWRLNAVPVPLNIRLLDNELEEKINHAQAKFCFIHYKHDNRLKNIINRISFPFTDKPKALDYRVKKYLDDSDALLMYTSGSSGNPKGVILTYLNLLRSAENTVKLTEQLPHDRWAASLPFYHIGGIQIIVRALLCGSSIVLPEEVKAGSIIKMMNDHKPTLTSLVTTVLRRFVQLEIKPNPEMRYVFIGGGPIDNELIKDALKLGWNIIKVYGSTETSSMVTALKYSEAGKKINSAGRVIDDTIIKIVNNSGNFLPDFSAGEIAVSGKTIMRGYWNNKSETAAKLKDGFYFTGDIGYLDNEKYLYVEARRSDLIISGGENINPLEIEPLLLKHEGINDVCIFPISDIEWGQTAAAAVQLKKGFNLSGDLVRDFLREKIASFKIPKKYFFIEKLPRNELGKINREEVRKLFENK